MTPHSGHDPIGRPLTTADVIRAMELAIKEQQDSRGRGRRRRTPAHDRAALHERYGDYVVDAEAVAAAIVERLAAGGGL